MKPGQDFLDIQYHAETLCALSSLDVKGRDTLVIGYYIPKHLQFKAKPAGSKQMYPRDIS